MEEKILAKIAKLKTERDTFVQQANQQVAALNGAIQALEQLLEKDPVGADVPDAAPVAEPAHAGANGAVPEPA